ncbi:hypothetical protein [Arthrobacter sp. SX1312]|uniref:hypothetical protein n=1 Tax=Arthrobacter sp. SX1312 TaxID=2058896 RepID=UPI0011B0D6B5|nr:hypothetical protein [Arthrobacter sp. SX1312]
MEEPLFGDAPALLRKILIARLLARFTVQIPVSTRRPGDLPPEFIRILLVGGNRKNKITVSRTFVIEAWAGSSARAVELVEATYSIIHSLENSVVDGVQFGAIGDFALPADLPDPDTEHSRFTFTTEIDMSYIDTI